MEDKDLSDLGPLPDPDLSIYNTIPDLANYKSFTDRYFSKRYALNVNGIKNNDVMIMFHSNRIALLSLAPSHFFFKKNMEYKVNFDIGGVNRLNNTVRGKGKKGGIKLQPRTALCRIDYTDGTSFDVQSCMRGILVEVNDKLVKSPSLLKCMPDADGYIAVVLASIPNSDATKKELLNHEDYIKQIENSDHEIEQQ